MSTGLPPGVPPAARFAIPFGPAANCTLDICPIEWSVYGYRPSLGANGAFIALYAIAFIIHTYLAFRWRKWFFSAAMQVCCLNGILGYAARIGMYYNPFSFSWFMMQIVCVTTGPVYYCAAIYVTLAMTIEAFSPALSRFNPKLFYWIFIPCDILSLAIQASGGALSTTSSGASQIGVNLGLAGMAFQVFTIVAFCVAFGDYLLRYYKAGLLRNNPRVTASATRLKLYFGFMSLCIILTLVRCAYRLVELKDGYRAAHSLVREENLFIGLEGVLVIVCIYCVMIGHPGLVFKESTTGAKVTQSDEEGARSSPVVQEK